MASRKPRRFSGGTCSSFGMDRLDRHATVRKSPLTGGREPGRSRASVGWQEVDQIRSSQLPQQSVRRLSPDAKPAPELASVQIGPLGQVFHHFVLRVRDAETLERLVQACLESSRESSRCRDEVVPSRVGVRPPVQQHPAFIPRTTDMDASVSGS